ncbi:MAG TPA: hypothetical protein VG713_15875 [Pirellulales bacterium]|nr:hypothetical protein [Pirellulales bacterium]
MLPRIRRRAAYAFRYEFNRDDFDDRVAETIAIAFKFYSRLITTGRASRVYICPLIDFSIREVLKGRRAASSNKTRRNDDVNWRAVRHSLNDETFVSHLVGYRGRIPDRVALKIDFNEWVKTLSPRDRRFVELLATGDTLAEAGAKVGIVETSARNLRRELCREWQHFGRNFRRDRRMLRRVKSQA